MPKTVYVTEGSWSLCFSQKPFVVRATVVEERGGDYILEDVIVLRGTIDQDSTLQLSTPFARKSDCFESENEAVQQFVKDSQIVAHSLFDQMQQLIAETELDFPTLIEKWKKEESKNVHKTH